MQPHMLEQLRDISGKLNLAQVGISTPWAARVSDLEWRELKAPDTNVVTFLINDVDMTRAQEAMFGSPLPFVLIKTLDPVSAAALQNALQNTAYEFFESFAVYRQDDPNPVPRIEFHHWARRLDLDAEGRGSMSAAADQLGGDLLFGQQVAADSSTIREAPAEIFQTAFDAQFLTPGPAPPQPRAEIPPTFPGEDSPGPELEAPAPSTPAKKPYWGPLLVAGAIATAIVFVGGRRRK